MRRMLLVLALVLGAGCAHAMDVGMIRSPQFVQQQLPIDCAIASLAMAADTTYARADHARESLRVHLEDAGGTPVTDIIAIGALLGLHLVPKDTVNFVVDEGIVVMHLAGQDDPTQTHAFYIKRGLVYDPAESMPVPWVLKREQWASVAVFLQKR